MATKPGEARAFVEKIVTQGFRLPSDQCIDWPFHKVDSYGMIWDGEKNKSVSQEILERLTPRGKSDQCAKHTCGNRACCNPHHLSWGDTRGENSPVAKLTYDQVVAIINDTGSPDEIAKTFETTIDTVKGIQSGRRWAHLPRPYPTQALNLTNKDMRDLWTQATVSQFLLPFIFRNQDGEWFGSNTCPSINSKGEISLSGTSKPLKSETPIITGHPQIHYRPIPYECP